jgi:hypothetical protein
MRLLYDRLTRADPDPIYAAPFRWLHDHLLRAQRFEASNVARYVFSDTPQEDWRPSRDFPVLTPPYADTWIEYQAPERIQAGDRVITYPDTRGQYGALVCRVDLQADEPLPLPGISCPDGTRWVIFVGVYAHAVRVDGHPFNRLWHFPLMFSIPLDGAGHALVESRPEGDLVSWHTHDVPLLEESCRSTWGVCTPALFALALLHCKNTLVEEHDAPPRAGRRDRRQSKPLHSFRTLRVLPMRKVVQRATEDARETGDPRKSRFHHRRGHFKTYDEAAPLFGRWVGSWWWSDQVAGDLSLGVIDKLYRIDTP